MGNPLFRTIAAGLAGLGLLTGTPANAQPDLMWVNPGGGISGLKLSDDPVVPLKPGTRSLREIVDGFDLLCMGTDFDKLAVNRVIAGSQWGGQYMPGMLSTKSGEVDMGGWQGEDNSLAVAKDVFFSPNPQCVLTVATATRYPAIAFFPVLTAKYGRPANFSEMFGPDGKPNDTTRPYWAFPGSTPKRERLLFARTLARGTEYRIHMALIERHKAD